MGYRRDREEAMAAKRKHGRRRRLIRGRWVGNNPHPHRRQEGHSS